MSKTHNTKKFWKAVFRKFEKTASGLTGKRLRVDFVEFAMEDQIGYTSSKGVIHLNPFHEMLNDMSDEEALSFMDGVFAHELLHQIFTNFRCFEKTIASYPAGERPIFSVINNILEDAAIEHFAPQAMGGSLLTDLDYMIATVYKKSPDLSCSSSPFAQYINALINFGDMGPLKGGFTYNESRKYFVKTAHLFEQGVHEPICKKRIELSAKIMEITKPLWEEEAKENEKMQKLMDELKKNMRSRATGSGTGKDAEADDGDDDSLRNRRRKITIKHVTKEELEEMQENGEIDENGDAELPDGDVTILVCDDDEDTKESKGNSISISADGDSSDEENESDNETEINSEDGENHDEETNEESDDKDSADTSKKNSKSAKNEDSEDEDSDDDSKNENSKGKKSANKNSDQNSSIKVDNGGDKKGKQSKDEDNQNDNSDKDNPFVQQIRTDEASKVKDMPLPEDYEPSDEENKLIEISKEEYEISEEDIERIKSEIETIMEEYNREEETNKEETSPVSDFDITTPSLGNRTCLNYRVVTKNNNLPILEDAYADVITKLSGGIKNLTNQLRRIFENDVEEVEHRTSGRINIKRTFSGRVTARVFDRHVDPNGKSDFCVEILVDESGSMASCNKANSAKECCIALSEVFASLHIPTYVIGFTADSMGYDVVHNHYITWKNTHNERLKLLNITARANNCDGYSIRYATEIIKKNKATHKLLIVLSDGQPAACSYYNGIADTKQAIKDARKYTNILGVAIGNNDTEEIFEMYENDFMLVSNTNDLFFGLSKKLQKMVKHWD